MSIIIVESPTKARTFSYLFKDRNYQIFSTLGHIRDLPKNKISIDYHHHFYPQYELINSKKTVISKIKEALKKDKEIILATDPDREGESISYHLLYLLGYIEQEWPEIVLKKNNFKRVVFHEITKSAIIDALSHPTEIRIDLVKAQMTRRILDRIVGYELSPVLWKKTGKNWLSAGRVQTAALRLIVEREKEVKQFVSEKYWMIEALFENNLQGRLIKINNELVEIKNELKLFDGKYTFTKTNIDNNKKEKIVKDLSDDSFIIDKIEKRENLKFPPPPFTTSLLQQQAFYRLNFSSKLTMKLAQDLYENGLITYHRTDSFNLSPKFLFGAKDYIKKKYGENYALEKPRNYKTKSKLAQEAHEAIRPTTFDESPSKLKSLTKNHLRLYQLIFKRALATQMKEAKIEEIFIDILSQKGYLFNTQKERVLFDGFLILEKENKKKEQNNSKSLSLAEKEPILLKEVVPLEKNTQPPPRYTEASLIKSLEEKGIGRPSTYAMIISLINQRNYIEKKGRYFIPTVVGESICQFLVDQFPQIFDLRFTAQMEDALDEIANHRKDQIAVLEDFYQTLINQKNKINYQEILKINEASNEKCPLCQHPLVIKYSKYGKFLACSNYPQCRFTKKINYYLEETVCPKCGGKIIIKFSKKGKRFYGCENYPKCDFSSWTKPKKI